MIDFSGIPCPKSLQNLHLTREPAPMAIGHLRASPGTVWEVESPGGEFLLFLVAERFDRTGGTDELPIEFVRAIPLTDHLGLQDDGDTVVYCRQQLGLLAAHVWMEGPVLMQKLKRIVDDISPDSLKDVMVLRGGAFAKPASNVVMAFRETLHDQFGPVYFEWWNEVEQKSEVQNTGAEKHGKRVAANDGGSTGPTPAEESTIAYLTEYLPEILRHGNGDVWFAVDSDGVPTAHTYNPADAAEYARRRGPHLIPIFANPIAMTKPDVQDLIHWLVNQWKVEVEIVESVCLNLRWPW